MEKKERIRNFYSELPEGEDSSPAKAPSAKKDARKGKENREIRILKKGKSIKERKDPDRFSGEGINFRAKIIGIENVFDARGNRMCQGALQKLKAAVKTSGDHKQRIILNISLNGIIIKDEKTGEVLHHHPIHKISFISQDTKDSRAFGYVYGCPQTGHRFFAIKTEKAASQVVVTLRDLFLVALEIKKKEIEKTVDSQKDTEEEDTKNKDVENGLSDEVPSTSQLFSSEAKSDESQRINHAHLYSNTVLLPEEVVPDKGDSEPDAAVETLLDLQSEVDTLQQGISQMDQSIAIAVSHSLGISFSEDEVSESSTSSIPTAFQFKLDKLSSLYQETLSISSRSSSTSDYNVCPADQKQEDDVLKKDPFMNTAPVVSDGCSSGNSSLSVGGNGHPSETLPPNSTSASLVEDRYAVFLDIDSLPSIFDDPSIVKLPEEKDIEALDSKPNDSFDSEIAEPEVKSSTPVAFAELDPLGNQPYVDKKDFFQDIKNPPKKVLKDLVGANVFYSSDSDAFLNPHECLTFKDSKFDSLENISNDVVPLSLTNPPKLPPKRVVGVSSFSVSSESFQDSEFTGNSVAWESKNPFNPFLKDDYPDMPPPSSPPPPPPPRMPTKVLESSPTMSPPPPRPPSRVNGIPTPPLPKRKVPLNSANRTWFSFDQDAVPFDAGSNHIAPPLPSPARKHPPSKAESPLLKSSSATNSPATMRRIYNKSAYVGNTIVVKESSEIKSSFSGNSMIGENVQMKSGSPIKISRHLSIVQDGDTFPGATFNPFLETSEYQDLPERPNESCSPPLPPKPASKSRSSPIKKVVSASSYSSSSASVIESSNGTHSSSSLAFSSLDDSKTGSSSEALFLNSTGSQSDVFPQEILQSQSSNGTTLEKSSETDLSPDSIFRRKSDPFADDFFLSLHKKSNYDTESITKKCSTVVEVEVPFDNLKAPT